MRLRSLQAWTFLHVFIPQCHSKPRKSLVPNFINSDATPWTDGEVLAGKPLQTPSLCTRQGPKAGLSGRGHCKRSTASPWKKLIHSCRSIERLLRLEWTSQLCSDGHRTLQKRQGSQLSRPEVLLRRNQVRVAVESRWESVSPLHPLDTSILFPSGIQCKPADWLRSADCQQIDGELLQSYRHIESLQLKFVKLVR